MLPKKGFDLILDRHGVCSAITTVSSSDLNSNPDLRDHASANWSTRSTINSWNRVKSDLEGRGHTVPPGATLSGWSKATPNSSAKIAVPHRYIAPLQRLPDEHVPAKGPENDLARDLCEYGRRLAPNIRGGAATPVRRHLRDFLAFLNVIAGGTWRRASPDSR